MTKISNKIWLLISIAAIATCAVLFASTFATADEPEGTYSIHGTVKDFDTKAPMQQVNVGRFVSVDSEDIAVSSETGEFTLTNVPCSWTGAIEAGYDQWDKYAADKVYVSSAGAKDTTVEVGDIFMHQLTTNISGRITDENGQPLQQVYLEFYNPNSPISPSPDIRVYTDADGTFKLDKNIMVFEPEKHYSGLGIGLNYTVSVMSVPTTWPAQNPKNYPTNLLSQTCDFTCTSAGTSSLNFQMTRIINIRMYDWDQGETTFFDYFYHSIYINGVCEDDTGIFGDTKLTIAGDISLSLEADCILKIAYRSNGNDVVETFEPFVVKSYEGWIPGEQLKQYKPISWVMNDVWDTSRPINEIKIGYNNVFKISDTRFIDLDVNFIENATPASIDTTLTEGHGHFHYVQTKNGKTYEYDEREFHQGNFFNGTEIYIDENNNLVYECEFPNSNAIQRTVVSAIPADGYSFVNWTNDGEVFTSNSEAITAGDEQVNLGVTYVSNAQTETAQTGDENGMLIIILAAIFGLAVIGLISYFVVNKLKNNKTKNRKH